jgi:two-component system KDP operon response regulator KdpE
MTTVGQEILVVDDEAPMRRFVGMNHTARGYQVLLAADGAEALEQVAKTHFDLLILDVGLPGP